MSLVNNSANNFKDFLDAIKPYLNYQFYDMSGQGVEANNFSTDEKVIGTWIDGKPLYQKTIDLGIISSKEYSIGAGTIDKVISIDGCICNTNNGTEYFVQLPKNNDNIYFKYKGDGDTLVAVAEGSWSSYYEHAYITLKYTKTTDTAVASGEKIVGQWIDGKPVYEKVITDTFPTSTGSTRTDKEIDLTSINIDLLISLNAIIDADGTPPISAYIGTGIDITGNVYYTSNKLTLRNQKQQNYNGAATYIILRYTKTT